MRGRWIGILALLASTASIAGELKVAVTDQRGRPVADAVVSVTPKPGTNPGVPKAPAPRVKTINQIAITFVPYLQVFRPGDKVVFHNSDRTRHHVYSFSPVKSFEFMLNPGETSPALLLDKTGVVAVGCNIHDPMITYLVVSDAPWVARTPADGKVVLSDLPAGSYSINTWQPRLKPGNQAAMQTVVMAPGKDSHALSFKLVLLPDSRRQPDHEHVGY